MEENLLTNPITRLSKVPSLINLLGIKLSKLNIPVEQFEKLPFMLQLGVYVSIFDEAHISLSVDKFGYIAFFNSPESDDFHAELKSKEELIIVNEHNKETSSIINYIKCINQVLDKLINPF